jgi:hypothetical protein
LSLLVWRIIANNQVGFAIKPTAWGKFLGGHLCASDNCAIELDIKKIDLDAYIVRTPPSWLKQRNF